MALAFLRDFHPDKEPWIARYGLGKHVEMRLAHVHGNRLALLNVAIGFVLLRLGGPVGPRKAAAGLSLPGMMMPLRCWWVRCPWWPQRCGRGCWRSNTGERRRRPDGGAGANQGLQLRTQAGAVHGLLHKGPAGRAQNIAAAELRG